MFFWTKWRIEAVIFVFSSRDTSNGMSDIYSVVVIVILKVIMMIIYVILHVCGGVALCDHFDLHIFYEEINL